MDKEFENFKVLTLLKQKALLKQWDKAYYEDDNPLVSDEVYDLCVNFYNAKSKNPYVSSLGKANTEYVKYTHKQPVLSLAKVLNKEDLDKWASKFNFNLVIQPKVDGLTVVYYPDGKLVSRGNGKVGEVLLYAHDIPNLPKNTLNKPIRMEVCIDKKVFEKHFKDSNKNARNMAAGILRRKTYSEEIKYLTYYAYNILDSDLSEEEQIKLLKDNGFNVVETKVVKNNSELDKFFPKFKEFVDKQAYPIDGVVLKCNDINFKNQFENTSHHPNHMIAYKFASEIKETILREVVWSSGRDTFTPIGIFDPVVLGGNTIQRASLHNLNIMAKLNVKIGAKILVTLKNEIIPQIVHCDNNEEFDSTGLTKDIYKCPWCGNNTVINKESGEISCLNPSCSRLLYNDILKISSKEGLNIEGISDAMAMNIRNYYKKNKEKNPFAFLGYEVSELAKALNVTPYMANKIHSKIQKAIVNVNPVNYLCACNINGLGSGTAKQILEYFNYDLQRTLKDFDVESKNIFNIGEILANKISAGFSSKAYSGFKYIKSFKKINSGSTTSKIKIAITGKLINPRKQYEEKINNSSLYEYSSSITKNVNLLVCGEDSGSKKEKAEKLNIKIISEQELMDLLSKEA